RNNRTDITHFEQCLFISLHQCIERAEMASEIARSCFADVADAKSIDEPVERGVPRFRQRCDDIGSGLFRHALEFRQRSQSELEQIGGRMHELTIYKLIDQLVAQSFDVQSPPAREVK